MIQFDRLKMVVRYDPPPVPSRIADWCCSSDDLEGLAGYGATPQEAIQSFVEQVESLEHV